MKGILDFIEPYILLPIILFFGIIVLIITTLFRSKVTSYAENWNSNVRLVLKLISIVLISIYVGVVVYLVHELYILII